MKKLMPKYYVKCLNQRVTIDAKDEMEACLVASNAMRTMTAGIYWVVSERGFEKHEDDLLISDLEIIKAWTRKNLEG